MPPVPPIPVELWNQIPPPAQAAIRALVQQYEQRLQALQTQVDHLRQRLNQDPTTSSRPPCSDPPPRQTPTPKASNGPQARGTARPRSPATPAGPSRAGQAHPPGEAHRLP